MPRSHRVQSLSIVVEFVADQVRRRTSRSRGKACRSGSSSNARNPELSLTSSIECSHYFAKGTCRRWGDMPVSITEHRRPAPLHVASPVWTTFDQTIIAVKLVVSFSCSLAHALVLWWL